MDIRERVLLLAYSEGNWHKDHRRVNPRMPCTSYLELPEETKQLFRDKGVPVFRDDIMKELIS